MGKRADERREPDEAHGADEQGRGGAEPDEAREARLLRGVLAAVLPIVFVAAGVPVVLYARAVGSWSLAATGLFLLIVAAVLAFAAIVLLLRRR